MIANLKSWAVLAFAILCLIGGLATVWLPIPTGVPLLALGSFLIIANSRSGRNSFRWLRKHVSWLDHALLWLEERTGRTVGRVLKTTTPLVTRHRRKAAMQNAQTQARNGMPGSDAAKDASGPVVAASRPTAPSQSSSDVNRSQVRATNEDNAA